MANIAGTLRALTLERSQVAGQVRRLDEAIAVLRSLAKGTRLSISAGGRTTRTMSAAGRRKIRAAQKARWAKWRAMRENKAA
jgi:hypothetical protein